MYKSLTKTNKYSEIETHETLRRVASANAISKHYKSSSLITIYKTPCNGSKLFKKLTLCCFKMSKRLTWKDTFSLVIMNHVYLKPISHNV